MTRAKRHLLEVKLLPCVLCMHLGLGESPADAHHLFDGHQRSDYLVAPLCPEHHRGPNGFHGLGGEPGKTGNLFLSRSNAMDESIQQQIEKATPTKAQWWAWRYVTDGGAWDFCPFCCEKPGQSLEACLSEHSSDSGVGPRLYP